MEWRHSGSPRPKKFRVKNPLENFSSRISWYQDGILLIDYLSKGQTINAEYYSYLLAQLKDILRFEGKTPRVDHQRGLVIARKCPDSPPTCNPEQSDLPGIPVS